MQLPALRDLDAAERWYRRSLDLFAADDRLGRSKGLSQLGYVAWERFKDARQTHAPEAELLNHLNAAAGYYNQGLALLPPDAVDALAVTHNQLGLIYKDAGDLERALYHYNQDIHYDEMAGNLYGAGQTRFNIALALQGVGRFVDALLYARAALRNFEPYGQGAAEDIQDTQRLIAQIEQAQRGG
jgi:tetratricopeptide (TPR) repeat protein